MTEQSPDVCSAYAALCQAEAMERIADVMEKDHTFITGVDKAFDDLDSVDSGYHNKGDQSIADAFSAARCRPIRLWAIGLMSRYAHDKSWLGMADGRKEAAPIHHVSTLHPWQ